MARRLLILATLIASLFSPFAAPASAEPVAQVGCTFKLGFATLRSLIVGAHGDVVGACLENERSNTGNGNAEQRTSGGLFVWRQADNWTAFTDGSRTWLNGPQGLQVRLNTERFAWEGLPVAQPPRIAAPPPPPPASGRLATLDPRGRQLGAFLGHLVDDLDAFWSGSFVSNGTVYRRPRTMWVEEPAVSTGCGFGQLGGPMYCGRDETIYLNDEFFVPLWLANQDAAVVVVVAHEWGHHVQNLLGVSARRLGSLDRLELQADCLAGVFFRHASSQGLIETGDVEEAVRISQASGSRGHGSGTARVRAFVWGLDGNNCAQV